MDVLAHGLWGGAVFGQRLKGQWKWAVVWGIAPDAIGFSFSLWDLFRLDSPRGYEPTLYSMSHSLLVWAGLAAVIWSLKQAPPWVFGAWALHIVSDIFTHPIRLFPTPFLWPFQTPFYDGAKWQRPGFMLANYALLAIAYALLLWLRFPEKAAAARQHHAIKRLELEVHTAYERTALTILTLALKKADLLEGAAELLALKTLSKGPLYGHQTAAGIRGLCDEALMKAEGTVYPVLYRLEEKGLVQSWRPSKDEPEAKFYELTPKGWSVMQEEAESWRRLSIGVSRVWKVIE